MMKLGLWNIDHPECHPDSPRRNRRFEDISTYVLEQNCDVYVLTEANAAMEFPGYRSHFSAESPFRNKSRVYDSPNRYHQVAVYDRLSFTKRQITEPVNGLLCRSTWHGANLFVYGNVITIKDQWSEDSDKTYSDRLNEQMDAFEQLSTYRGVIAGDFNLRLGWPQRKKAHERVKAFADRHRWMWPTESQTGTVQHVLHSPDLVASVTIDMTVRHTKGKRDRLSDHPSVLVELRDDVSRPGMPGEGD
jgi:hypothetical protein